jgi:hypothetical protein
MIGSRSVNRVNFVLFMRVDIKGNAHLVSFDKLFWAVTVDGRAATEADLDDLTRKPKLKATMDPLSRQVQIKLPRT